MQKIKHKFLDRQIDISTETLIIGTFNPDINNNPADFFYSRGRNYLWQLLPTAHRMEDLKGKTRNEKESFIQSTNIDFIDLISEIEVSYDEKLNYSDQFIENKVIRWTDVIGEIKKLKGLKRVGFTRRTFAGIPQIKTKTEAIQTHCEHNNIVFQYLVTPARYYNLEKQNEWNGFLLG